MPARQLGEGVQAEGRECKNHTRPKSFTLWGMHSLTVGSAGWMCVMHLYTGTALVCMPLTTKQPPPCHGNTMLRLTIRACPRAHHMTPCGHSYMPLIKQMSLGRIMPLAPLQQNT